MSKLTKTEELADRLHSAAIHLLRQVRVQDVASGLAPARLSALSVLVFGGAMSLNELARAEQVRPPTMSRIVDALESENLIRRTVNPQDRRAVVLEATEKGTAILWQGRKRRVKFLAKHISRLSEQERRQIDDAVKAIQKAMVRQP
jgi:DNA-binding MarR family transcriptional regulator